MTEAISDFRGDHDFLSNFYAAPVVFEDTKYPTVEHAFQAAKTDDFALRRKIRNAASPSSAKAMGRKLKRRDDWFSVSLTIMEDLIRYKFTNHADLRARLIATADAPLIEGNNWGDTFYGCVWDAKKNEWRGENHLGRILMKIRDEIR